MDEREKFKLLVESINFERDLGLLNSKLIDMLNNIDNIPTKELMAYLSTDISLVTRILKIVNSAYWGMSQNIVSLQQAIVLLGRQEIKKIILAGAYINTLYSMKLNPKVMSRFLKISYISGEMCRILCERYFVHIIETLDEAFVSGLLHLVGKMFIARYVPESSETIKDFWNRDSFKAEREIFGFDHTMVTKYVLEKIGFNEISLPTSQYLEPFDENSLVFSRLIGLSDLFAYTYVDNSPIYVEYFSENGYALSKSVSVSLEEANKIISQTSFSNVDTFF